MQVDSNFPEVVRTAADAAASKLAAVKHGYYNDGYLRALDLPVRKRTTIINRGTYARTLSVETVCKAFLDGCPQGDGQLVLLGAGRDSLFFRLAAKGVKMAKCLEVDAKSVSDANARFIAKSQTHCELLGLNANEAKPGDNGLATVQTSGGSCEASFLGPKLAICAADITNLEELGNAFEASEMDPSKPTLFVAECVLAYLDPKASERLLEWCAQFAESSAFVAFDMINPEDSFGRMMLQNLASSGLRLPGMEGCPTVEAHRARMLQQGFTEVNVAPMLQVYDEFFSNEERARVSKIEWLDEVEEWNLIMNHYCFAVGVKGDAISLLSTIAGPLGTGNLNVPFQTVQNAMVSPKPCVRNIVPESPPLVADNPALSYLQEAPRFQRFDSADWAMGAIHSKLTQSNVAASASSNLMSLTSEVDKVVPDEEDNNHDHLAADAIDITAAVRDVLDVEMDATTPRLTEQSASASVSSTPRTMNAQLPAAEPDNMDSGKVKPTGFAANAQRLLQTKPLGGVTGFRAHAQHRVGNVIGRQRFDSADHFSSPEFAKNVNQARAEFEESEAKFVDGNGNRDAATGAT